MLINLAQFPLLGNINKITPKEVMKSLTKVNTFIVDSFWLRQEPKESRCPSVRPCVRDIMLQNASKQANMQANRQASRQADKQAGK